MIKLSILILTIPERYDFMKRLSAVLDPQLQKYKGQVECLTDDSRYKNVGRKRNDLKDRASGDYLQFIDDDDLIAPNYITLQMVGINKDVDCCSLKGIITEDGENPQIFEHSIKYGIYKTITDSAPGEVRYERYPNHLNCIKAAIAKRFRFPEEKHSHGDANHGEDTHFAEQVHLSGMIKTEHYIPEVLYYYQYRRNK